MPDLITRLPRKRNATIQCTDMMCLERPCIVASHIRGDEPLFNRFAASSPACPCTVCLAMWARLDTHKKQRS